MATPVDPRKPLVYEAESQARADSTIKKILYQAKKMLRIFLIISTHSQSIWNENLGVAAQTSTSGIRKTRRRGCEHRSKVSGAINFRVVHQEPDCVSLQTSLSSYLVGNSFLPVYHSYILPWISNRCESDTHTRILRGISTNNFQTSSLVCLLTVCAFYGRDVSLYYSCINPTHPVIGSHYEFENTRWNSTFLFFSFHALWKGKWKCHNDSNSTQPALILSLYFQKKKFWFQHKPHGILVI